ncbi:MAG: hypothetical protein IT509_13135 [Rhodocyclaceae bacterium]|nr:hypothetical protein [Rhodocyclaceae bacterium]
MRATSRSLLLAGLHGRLLTHCVVAMVLIVTWWAATAAAAAPRAQGVAGTPSPICTRCRTEASPAHSVEITSIRPNPANRSERVKVSGHGFGARNVVVRLGGQPVLADVAFGSRIEFVVPEYGPVGDLLLEVVNPGGKTATATLTVHFDGRVKPAVDRSRTVTRSIGPAGGSITVGDTTLTIPPKALLAPVNISMSPLAGLTGSPLSPLYGAVQLEPSGLTLLQPAQLSMPLRTSAADLAMFLYEGNGEDMHLVPWSSDGQTVAIQVSHFSGGGSGSAANATSMFSFSPSNSQARAEQQIAIALMLFAQGHADARLFNAMVDQALMLWYASIVNGFQVAQGGPVEYFEFAIGDWFAWLTQIVVLGRDGALAPQVSASEDMARGVAVTQARRILATCTGADPKPFTGVAEIIHLVGLLELDDAVFDLTAVAPDLANGQNLVFQCMRIDIDLFDGPPVFARYNTHNTMKLRAQVTFANGAPRRDIPLVFEIEELRDLAAPTPLVNELVLSGSLLLTGGGCESAGFWGFARNVARNFRRRVAGCGAVEVSVVISARSAIACSRREAWPAASRSRRRLHLHPRHRRHRSTQGEPMSARTRSAPHRTTTAPCAGSTR